MLKRKLKANLEIHTAKKRAQERERLSFLFTSEQPRPTTVEEALKYIESLVIWEKFCNKIPAITLQSQLYALFSNHTKIDSEIDTLRRSGRIILIKLDTGTYGIVTKPAYIANIHHQMKEEGLDTQTGSDLIAFCSEDDLDIELTANVLHKSFSEEKVTQLVRAGFLTPEITGMFYLTVPNSSLFLRTLHEGQQFTKAIIKRSKFSEIQMTQLMIKKSKKVSKLGTTYYCLDLIGSETVKVIDTTSGPILRYNDDAD